MARFNIGILAHVDAGKTTITEQMLYLAGGTRTLGAVDKGDTTTDYLDVERRRGISVKNACVTLLYGNHEIQIIDTPGHIDFAGEVVRSLQALDAVILVISAAEGVQAQTASIFQTLVDLKIPVLLVVNKVDRIGFHEEELLATIREELSKNIIPLETVKNPERDACEIIVTESDEHLFELLAEIDEEMEEYFLMEEMPSHEEIENKFTYLSKNSMCYPLLFTAAKDGKGIREILELIPRIFPTTDETSVSELSGVVFQVQHDPLMGRVSFVRMFGGTLKSRDIVPFPDQTEDELEKTSQIRLIQGGKFQDRGEVKQGEIAALYGLNNCKIGQWFGIKANEERFNEKTIRALSAEPMLMTEIKPVNEKDEIALAESLTILSDEDPFLHYERNPLTGQMFLHITGEIQVEILKELLLTEYHLDATFSKPRVIYKEKPGMRGMGREAYTMPKPCWAIVQLNVEPLPPGSGVQFESVIKDNVLHSRYQNHVRESLYQTIEQGYYGWEVIDCKFTLVDGNSHIWHTHPLDFFVATPIAVLRALEDSAVMLMEPYMHLSIRAEEGYLGKVTADILKMRGTFDPPVMKNGQFYMEGRAPLSECMDYPITLRSMTSGKGNMNLRSDGYEPCLPGVIETFPRKGVNPLDRSKWILSCRSAL